MTSAPGSANALCPVLDVVASVPSFGKAGKREISKGTRPTARSIHGLAPNSRESPPCFRREH